MAEKAGLRARAYVWVFYVQVPNGPSPPAPAGPAPRAVWLSLLAGRPRSPIRLRDATLGSQSPRYSPAVLYSNSQPPYIYVPVGGLQLPYSAIHLCRLQLLLKWVYNRGVIPPHSGPPSKRRECRRKPLYIRRLAQGYGPKVSHMSQSQ